MEIIYKILGMYGIAFSIAMFVAFVIWALNWALNELSLSAIKEKLSKNKNQSAE
jgi:hypothetical protein